MKECIDCGKKLGIVEGYCHPTKGKDYVLCSNCFDTVSASVEKYREFISQYNGFFNKETSTIDDIQKIRQSITKRLKNTHNRINSPYFHLVNKNTNEDLSIIH